MTDLHTHILPGMDDGAQDPEDALALMELERSQGVERIALTSHFRPDQTDPAEFARRRSDALEQLRAGLDSCLSWPRLKAGCEIYYTPRLTELDLQPLCLEGTDLLLLELPTGMKPRYLRETLEELSAQRYVPLIAHAERYAYVLEDPGLLAQWMELGALIQINASTIVRGDARAEFCLKLIKWGLVHAVASDTHSTNQRPPNLDRGLSAIRKRLGEQTVLRLEQNARTLFDGGIPELETPHVPRKFLGRWI